MTSQSTDFLELSLQEAMVNAKHAVAIKRRLLLGIEARRALFCVFKSIGEHQILCSLCAPLQVE